MKLSSDTKVCLINRADNPYSPNSAEEIALLDLRQVTKKREFVSMREILNTFESTINFYESTFPILLKDGLIEIQDSLLSLIESVEDIIPELTTEQQTRLKAAIERSKRI